MRLVSLVWVALAFALFAGAAEARPHKRKPHHGARPHHRVIPHHGAKPNVLGQLHLRKPARPAPPVHFSLSHVAPALAPVVAKATDDTLLVTLQAKLMLTPDYPGAARYSPIGYPSLSFRWKSEPEIWSSPDDRLSVRLYSTPFFAIGPVLNYQGGRYDMMQALGPLKGVHDVPWTLEAGIFADLWLLQDSIRIRGDIRHGFRSDDGLVGTLGGDWIKKYQRFTFGVGPRLKFGDRRFMNDLFGVSAADHLAMPALRPYKPIGGLYSAGLSASATYKQSEPGSYTVHGGYDRLTEQAADSPIVNVSGSRDQWIAGATASYTFEVAR